MIRLNKFQKKKKLEKLEKQRLQCEEAYFRLMAFRKLPYVEQQKIREEWDKYYKDVKDTPVYAMYCLMKEAFLKNDFGGVKVLSNTLREMKENEEVSTIAKPRSSDPYELENNVHANAYLNVVDAIIALQEDKEDDNDIFGQ